VKFRVIQLYAYRQLDSRVFELLLGQTRSNQDPRRKDIERR
jgi:hypothetical protein